MKKFFLYTTGNCYPSQSDYKLITAYIKENEWKLAKKIGNADIVIVYTCAFTKDKEDKSLNLIKQAYQEKKGSAQLIVVGCLPAINKDRLSKVHKGIAVTANSLKELDDLLQAKVSIKEISYTGSSICSNKNKHKEYLLRIGWGCNGECSYCAIKIIFGQPHSRPVSDIILEYEKAYRRGYRKFALISDDPGTYGKDVNSSLAVLFEELCDKHTDCKFTLASINPHTFKSIFPYLEKYIHQKKIWRIHLPVESGSNRIIRLMNRFYTVDDFKSYIEAIVASNPAIDLRTDILVGFPRETEYDFQQTLKLVGWLGRYKVEYQCLPYSRRPNTKADSMSGHLDQKTKATRFKILQRLCWINSILNKPYLFKQLTSGNNVVLQKLR